MANAIADYLNNNLYGGLLGREADAEGFKFWSDAATANNWSTSQLQDEFAKAAVPELLNKQTANVPVYQSSPVPTSTPYQSTPAPAYNSYQSAPTPAYQQFQSKAFNFEADPGYAFRKEQGDKALQAKQLASGGFFAGSALKEAADYNSGLASQEYGNAFNRYLQQDSVDFRNHQANFNGDLSSWSAADNSGFRNNQANNNGQLQNWTANDNAGYRNNQANFNNSMTAWSAADAAGYRNNTAAYDRAWNQNERDYTRWVDDWNRTTQADDTNWERLTYLDKAGLNAAGANVNVDSATSAQIAKLLQEIGDADAIGTIGGSNAKTNALKQLLYLLG